MTYETWLIASIPAAFILGAILGYWAGLKKGHEWGAGDRDDEDRID